MDVMAGTCPFSELRDFGPQGQRHQVPKHKYPRTSLCFLHPTVSHHEISVWNCGPGAAGGSARALAPSNRPGLYKHLSVLPPHPTAEPWSALAQGTCQSDTLTPLSLRSLKCSTGSAVAISEWVRAPTPPNTTPLLMSATPLGTRQEQALN